MFLTVAPQPDVEKPIDPFSLVGVSWPVESESAYHVAETVADNAGTTAETQAQSASDAEKQTVDGMQGKTADSVSSGYASAATYLTEQSLTYKTISGWMLDAAGKIRGAKKHIANLVRAGTSEIRDALNSELSGSPVSPSSSELTAKYRADIAQLATYLTIDLDGIGHSLAGAPGASRTPSYVSVATTSTPERPDPHVSAASYTGDHHAPAPEPRQLPEMPRVVNSPNIESPSTTSTPAAPATTHAVNPILSNLISGGQSASPSGTPTAPSVKSSSDSSSGTPAGKAAQAHQSNEQHQQIRPTGLPRIPSVALPNIPAVGADIATAVSSATAQQLPTTTAPTAPGSSQIPVSTGLTPGVSGAAPAPSAPPAGLSPVGGLSTPPVVQGAPTVQGTPGTTSPAAPAPSPQSPPAPPRGPAADLGWIQRTYGLAPGVELPKSENQLSPAVFIADLAEGEAHLHRALATLRHAFDDAGWGQPMAVASIKRGFETKLVYVTADALSIHPHGVLLPTGVLPLDEMPSASSSHDLHGSLMVTDKLVSMIPRGWEVESLLSTVSGGESSQSAEQFQELGASGELLPCTVSCGRDDVRVDEALSAFARAAIGSGGCGELEVESARLRAARWIGVQPTGYLGTLARWYLADAAEQMSRGNWGEAVYSSEKYMSTQQSRSQAA